MPWSPGQAFAVGIALKNDNAECRLNSFGFCGCEIPIDSLTNLCAMLSFVNCQYSQSPEERDLIMYGEGEILEYLMNLHTSKIKLEFVVENWVPCLSLKLCFVDSATNQPATDVRNIHLRLPVLSPPNNSPHRNEPNNNTSLLSNMQPTNK